jgi:hypothetical protein
MLLIGILVQAHIADGWPAWGARESCRKPEGDTGEAQPLALLVTLASAERQVAERSLRVRRQAARPTDAPEDTG